MTIEDRILKRNTVFPRSRKEREESLDGQRYDKFLQICERLQERVDLSSIYCSTYSKVFELVENKNVDISDIVSDAEYADFKQALLEDKVQNCPQLGKKPDKTYDLRNPEDYAAYMEKRRANRR